MKVHVFKKIIGIILLCSTITCSIGLILKVSSIVNVEADSTKCYTRIEGILHKCNERNDKECIFIINNGTKTVLCRGDLVQWMEPVPDVRPPEIAF